MGRRTYADAVAERVWENRHDSWYCVELLQTVHDYTVGRRDEDTVRHLLHELDVLSPDEIPGYIETETDVDVDTWIGPDHDARVWTDQQYDNTIVYIPSRDVFGDYWAVPRNGRTL